VYVEAVAEEVNAEECAVGVEQIAAQRSASGGTSVGASGPWTGLP
jgi:hypothetical protein